MVLTSLSWLEPDLDRADSKFLKNNLNTVTKLTHIVRGIFYSGWLKESCDILSKLWLKLGGYATA